MKNGQEQKTFKLRRGIIFFPLVAAFFCLLFSYLFWAIWFYLISRKMFGIGMGLGGALYYIFFTVPVLVGSLLYQFLLRLALKRKDVSYRRKLFLHYCVPFAAIAFLLMLFCPMDGSKPYLIALYEALTGQ